MNATIPVLEPIATSMSKFMRIVSALVGGMFGIYVILFIWRIYSYKRVRGVLKKLRKDIAGINDSLTRIEKKIDALKRQEKRKLQKKRKQ